MDYDATPIPAIYREARAMPVAVLRMWLQAVKDAAPQASGSLVVDAGCGTGRFSGGLAEAFSALVLGVDRSARMLAEAGAPAPSVHYCRGTGRRLPVADKSAGLVFASNSIHHLGDLAGVAVEFARVLVPGGHVAVRNYLRDYLDGYPYLEFFPEAAAVSRGTVPAGDEIVAAFAGAGFALGVRRAVSQPVADSPVAYLEKIRARAYSDLVAIPDDAFRAGVARMTAAVSQGWGRSLQEPIGLLVLRKP